ncbi:hypothetical protein J3R30DRAFT_3560936 [Lentinula aciculospora]|uniref:Uncharacterized protein n=1 Tax=Lentinula aciculospora TaxID=153920 RepID=A0A9W9DGF8_9AGAR|nr:hypothetical protein J3R30DRAFT_3560936 [Lentinula aciculospora]
MLDSRITLLAILCHLTQTSDALPISSRQTRTCFDENDNPIACPQAKWSKAKIIIICTIVGIVLFLIIASYIIKTRRVQPMRPLGGPLRVQPTREYPQPESLPYGTGPLQKDKIVHPYIVSEQDVALIPPPPAYTPTYKL